MIILGIDTSFDETSVAVCDGVKVLSNVISSQVRYHKKYGGVVPFLTQRYHKERIDAVIEQALVRSGKTWKDIEAIAVTYGPGLAPALEVGLQKARELSLEHSLPLYPINHMAGHIASCFVQTGNSKQNVELPALALLVSGCHTELVRVERFGQFEMMGQTLDDALGEAYDKVARMLGLGYPGGRLVAKMAESGDPSRYNLPIPMQKRGDLNFSYSGLKTAVRMLTHTLKDGNHNQAMTAEQVHNVSATFQDVALASLVIKTQKALKQFPEAKTLLLAGGVAANTELRKRLRLVAKQAGIELIAPRNQALCTDNAAMIAVAGYLSIQEGAQPVKPEEIDRDPNLSL